MKISLKSARVNAKMTLEQAGVAVGVHPTTLFRWERDPSIVKAQDQKKISEAFGMPIENIEWEKADDKPDGEELHSKGE